MNQKETVKQILKNYEAYFKQYHHEIIIGKYYNATREEYDPSGEAAVFETAISQLKRIITAWEIIENAPILNTEIIKSITLPLQFCKGKQWVDPIDIRIASANAILIH